MADSENSRKYKILSDKKRALGQYSLRFLQDADIESIRNWRNEQMKVLRQREAISSEQQINYFKNSVWPEMDKDRPSQILFGIQKNNELIGYGGLVHIAWADNRAEISFLVAPERAASNITYEEDMIHFFKLIQNVGFQELGFEKLFTETYSSRNEHIKILKKSGMVHEATLKSHVLIDGQRLDSLIHAIFR